MWWSPSKSPATVPVYLLAITSTIKAIYNNSLNLTLALLSLMYRALPFSLNNDLNIHYNNTFFDNSYGFLTETT